MGKKEKTIKIIVPKIVSINDPILGQRILVEGKEEFINREKGHIPEKFFSDKKSNKK